MGERETLMTITFASYWHRSQTRKESGLPYIVHPIDVLTLIGRDWGISNEIIWNAAICHDMLEDTECTYDCLEINIGDAAPIVQELTFNPKDCSKEEYMGSFATKSLEAFIIKIADRVCNTRDFFVSNPRYAKKYFGKAHNLLQVFEDRYTEIAEQFGVEVLTKMQQTINSLRYRLVLYHET